jgi:hypothetical protein
MITNVEWGKIQAVVNTLKGRNYNDNQPVHVAFLISGRNPDTRKLKFADLATFMWRLFDDKQYKVEYVKISLPGGEVLFSTGGGSGKAADEKLPTSGNPELVRYWNKRTRQERDANLKVLWSQIASELFPIRNGRS